MIISGNDTIAIDFDGVIHKCSKGHHDGTIYDDPMPGTKDALEFIESLGYKIIIFTVRRNDYDIPEWLEKHGIKHYPITHTKPPARLYIDDKALRFENWNDVMSFMQLLGRAK